MPEELLQEKEQEILDNVIDPAKVKEEKKRIKSEKKRLQKEMKDLKKNAKESEEEGEESGSAASVMLITFFIVLIWLAILAMVIKLDVGGLGSNLMAPLIKDVPILNALLPAGAVTDDSAASGEEGEEYYGYSSLEEAVEQIKALQLEIDQLKTANTTDEDSVQSLKDEIARLKTFEDNQVEFQKVKTEFYEDVVYNDNAPDISEYIKYYESIDPENAEYLYKQAVEQSQGDETLKEYVQAYSDMKPKQAAAIFEAMPDNLDLTAKILGGMDTTKRAKILGAMSADLASKVTKLMDPEG